MTGKSVLLLGATGLVGSECLQLLTNNPAFTRIVILTRRPIHRTFPNHVEQHTVDFDNPVSYQAFLNVDSVICALGTTIKKAGSKESFRRVDYFYPLTFAAQALEAGANHFLLVSSIGADSQSSVFYLHVKGQLEEAMKDLGYPAFSIFRPSMLLGKREEFRLGEAIGKVVSYPIRYLIPRKSRPIQAVRVAEAIVSAAAADRTGFHVHQNKDMI